MARLIDADKLEKEMYHEAFETDSELQKWDSGCWIRYKMFEECIVKQPTVDAVEVVRCKDCRFNVENMKNDPLDATDYSDITCSYFMTDGMKADDFCCMGEKMDGGDK